MKLEDKIKLLTSREELRERYLDMPSILAWDFNMIISLTEKRGGTITVGRDFVSSKNFINNMTLVDDKIINATFTWNKKGGGSSQVTSKPNGFIISKDLFLIGHDMSALILSSGGLDHLHVHLETTFIGTPRNIPFRFGNFSLSRHNFTRSIDKW